MIKKIGILLFILWADLSSAQSWYNRTLSKNPLLSANTGIIELNKDTLVISALSSSITDFSFSQRILYFTSAVTGDTLSSIKIRDTTYYSSSIARDLFFLDNSYYLLTFLQKPDSSAMAITKLKRNGEVVWDIIQPFTYLYYTFRSVISINDTTLLICGEKESSFDNLDMHLLWVETNGNVLNERIYNLPNSQYAYQIDQFSNGDILLTGANEINVTNFYRTFYRLAPNGDVIWQKNVGGNGYNAGSALLSSDNSIYYTGQYAYPSQTLKARVIKLNQFGDTLWSYTRPQMDLIQNPNQNSYEVAVEGENQSITSLGRYYDTINNRVTSFLQNITADGKSKWLRKISIRTGSNYNTDLIRATNGDYIFTGYVSGNPLLNLVQDGWLVRTNCIGLFEGPEDSLAFSQYFNVVSLNNFANHFAYSVTNWGDGTTPETIESNYSDSLEKITHAHGYTYPGSYTITHKTIACNETLTQTFPITIAFTPASFNQLSLFPNPNNGSFTLALTHEALAQVRIYENNGKIVYEEDADLNGGKQMDFQHLAAGIYLVIVEVDGQKWRLKMVVE
jgi:hypothetical protein